MRRSIIVHTTFNPFTPKTFFSFSFWNTKYPDAKSLPVLANGGLLHTTRGENMEITLLCTEDVALQAIVVFVFARGLDEKKYIVLIPLPSLIKNSFVRSFVRYQNHQQRKQTNVTMNMGRWV